MAIDLFKNQSTNNCRNTGCRYEKSIKEFVVTLHYHSQRGYRFVKKTLCLPSPSTIRNWATNVEAEPGFLIQVIRSIRNMKCPDCANALYQSSNQDHVLQSKTTLLSFKAYGNLFVPSSSLYRVVQTTDKLVREMLVNWHDTSKQRKERVVLEVVKELKNRVFLCYKSTQCRATF